MAKKSAALENVNLFIVNQKINDFMSDNNLQSLETNCRLAKIVLRQKVRNFPTNIPFIAIVKKCEDGKQVVFNVKAAKMDQIDDAAIASETKVNEKAFVIDGIPYEIIDKINGFARYQPKFNKTKNLKL